MAERHRLLASAIAIVALAFVTGSFWVGTYGWFSGDDFAFLYHVQNTEPATWFDPVAALDYSFWIFFRPLGMEGYYGLGHALFGLEPFGFVCIGVAVTCLTLCATVGIARHLGFSLPAAMAAGLLAVSRPAASAILYDFFSFQYTSAIFFFSLSVLAFLTHLSSKQRAVGGIGGWVFQAASTLTMGLGLLCNDVAATVPAVAGLLFLLDRQRTKGLGVREVPMALASALRAVAPQIVVLVAYVFYRSALLDGVEIPFLYTPIFGDNIPRNVNRHVLMLFGQRIGFAGNWPLRITVFAAISLVTISVMKGNAGQRVRSWLMPLDVACIIWALGLILPFSVFVSAGARWASVMALPIGLLLGSTIDVFWQSIGERRPAIAGGVIVALLAAALPWSTWSARAEFPRGTQARQLYHVVASELGPVDETTRFRVLYGSTGLASPRTLEKIQHQILGDGFGFLQATFPERSAARSVHLSWHNASTLRALPDSPDRCVYLTLDEKGYAYVASIDQIRLLLPPALHERCETEDA